MLPCLMPAIRGVNVTPIACAQAAIAGADLWTMAHQDRFRTGLITWQPNLWKWIHASLESHELHALACLTVFGGSFGKAGVAALKVAEGLDGSECLLEVLHLTSVVRKVPGEERYSMHPMVKAVGVKLLGNGQNQLTARQYFLMHMLERSRELYSLGQGPESLAQVLCLLGQELPNFRAVATALDWSASKEVQLSEDAKKAWLIFAADVYTLANQLKFRGHLVEAALLQRQVLAVYTGSYGSRHAVTARLTHTLAQSLYEMDQLEEAERLHRQALDVQKGVLGPEHAETVTSQHNLAMVLLMRGRKEEANGYLRQVLDVRKRALEGKIAPQPEALEGVARVLMRLERIGEATALQRRALELRKQAGQGGVWLADKCNDLAAFLALDKQWTEAEQFHREALAIREQVLGRTHTSTAGSYLGLGVVLEEMGQLSEAERYLRTAVEVYEQAMGYSHAVTAMMCDRLAGLLHKQERLQEAEALYARVLAVHKRQSRADLLASAQQRLADVRRALGQPEEV